MRQNSVKQALRDGRVQLGCSCFQLRSADAVRALGAAGLDWVFFDAEHGAYGYETLQDLMRVATSVGLCPIVRVADLEYSLIARALDCGAEGVVLPRVESPELLAQAVSWTRFPPMGARGFGLAAPQLGYGPVSIADAIAHVNANVLVVLQVETRRALDRLDELLAVPHVDAVLIGPGDLSVSLGIPGEFDHPTFVKAVETVRDRCLDAGIAPGIHMRALDQARKWRERGMRLVSCNSDLGFLFDRAAETVNALRSEGLNLMSAPNAIHAGQPVLHFGPKPEAARLCAIAIHGRGASADDILSLAREFTTTDVAFLAPEAAGNTWYPYSFLSPLEKNEPWLTSALGIVATMVGVLATDGVPSERVAILGFSQGACLTLEFAARNPRRYAAIIGLSGGLIGPPGTPRAYPGSLDGTPVFLGCSDVDAHIPVERVRESAAVLRAMHANVDERIYRGMGHTVNSDEVAAVRALLGGRP